MQYVMWVIATTEPKINMQFSIDGTWVYILFMFVLSVTNRMPDI